MKDEISNYIIFKLAEYETIDNIVFYNKELNIDDNTKNDLKIIAQELKEKYSQQYSIAFMRKLGNNRMYRFMQIIDGQIIKNTDMNITISPNDRIYLEFLGDHSWENGTDINNLKISQFNAKQIAINYLASNSSDYNELKKTTKSSEICIIELYKYNSKTAWKMQFFTGNSYLIIDANTGEILDKYFSNGIYYSYNAD